MEKNNITKDSPKQMTSNYGDITNLPDSPEPYISSIVLPEIKGTQRILKSGDIAIFDGNVELSTKKPQYEGLRHFNDLPLIEMNFVIEGHTIQKQSYLKQELLFSKGYHNIMYNIGEWEHNRFMGSGNHRTTTLYIHTDRFVQLFGAYNSELNGLANKVLKQEPFMVDKRAIPFTPYMYGLIKSLWDCPYNGGLGKMYIETKVMELMMLQCAQFTLSNTSLSILKHAEDMDKMYYAREILLKNITDPPTLSELARLSGVNEFKLKKGFKEVFKDTVFGYFNSVRLEKARELILNTNQTMSEIAYQTGYCHPQHFNRAFKKQFGIAPGAYRN